jgi:predicted RNase H-like HicB family nuclease
MRLFLTVKTWKEGKHYIAYTPELDLASQGKNIEHAEKRLSEAVSAFVEEVKRKGVLKNTLKSLGFLKERKKWKSPRISFSEIEMKS